MWRRAAPSLVRALRSRPVALAVGGVAGSAMLMASPAESAFVQRPTVEQQREMAADMIKEAIINKKVNACPMAVRVAWHASGTFDKTDYSGGSNGGGMRFEPEHSDPANAGLFIIHDLLERVKQKCPDVSYADLWTLAGCKAVEFMGGARRAGTQWSVPCSPSAPHQSITVPASLSASLVERNCWR